MNPKDNADSSAPIGCSPADGPLVPHNPARSPVVKRKVWLSKNFAVGVGPMTAVKVPWWDIDKYFYLMRYHTTRIRAWSIRILWFHFGRITERYEVTDDGHDDR